MTTASPHAHGVHFGRADVQNVGIGVGIVLMLVGLLGFIPGVTTEYSELRFFGPDSQAMLFGVFQVSMLLNIVQVAIGATGWAMSRSEHGARNFLLGAGALYIVLAIFGLSVGVDSAANFLALNMLDNWTHLGLGIVMILAGWLFSRNMASDRT
ncbi:DUF4383 domain-containing protein [Pseudarthrobacter phenanthrenivorans]|uniref:DUF4383 domain-containing protein n=1 Tax=Pseudarthrobacter phenanthrenivorans TaxID=361575 RepID=A0A3B0G1Z8_PSEPS|nr:DUF4383 domain-containing protein [Pseudarthrobacter phenanthrenivorans]RKO26210.1 DUF4383 domain-containing protein [Pseudarthrobacter phenanthrenivorans]TPV48646.1 DUF4383 domain-containing protein [Pseudarthrobacter phenanthrenivorans]